MEPLGTPFPGGEEEADILPWERAMEEMEETLSLWLFSPGLRKGRKEEAVASVSQTKELYQSEVIFRLSQRKERQS